MPNSNDRARDLLTSINDFQIDLQEFSKSEEDVKAAFLKLHGDLKATNALLTANYDDQIARLVELTKEGNHASHQFKILSVEVMYTWESWLRRYRRGARASAPEAEAKPSTRALVLLAYLAPAKEREAILGDAEEQFRSNSARFGTAHARYLLWWDALRSTFFLGMRLAMKPLVAALAYFGLGEISK